jgi:long-subunit fatty acid transport protein
VDLSAGFGFTHFSNGSVKLPNYGMNMIAPKFSLKYIFDKRPEFIKTEKPVYKPEMEWLILFSPSFRQIAFGYYDENNDSVAIAFDYKIFNLSGTFNYQITHMIKFGAGFDLSYNEAYGAKSVLVDGIPEKEDWQFKDKILFGVYPSFELVINKVSLIMQPGFYLYRKKVEDIVTPSTYQRIGLKYHFNNHWLAGINVRAFNFSKADFIEFNVGYRIMFQRAKKN